MWNAQIQTLDQAMADGPGRAYNDVDLKVNAINRLFAAQRLRDRCDEHVDGVYRPSYDNRKARKALKNQLFTFLKKEMDMVRNSIRVYQRHQTIRQARRAAQQVAGQASVAAKAKRGPTAYAQFCKRMRETKPHHEIVGKLQSMWREERGLQPKDRKRERYVALSPIMTEEGDENNEEVGQSDEARDHQGGLTAVREGEVLSIGDGKQHPHYRYESDSSSDDDDSDSSSGGGGGRGGGSDSEDFR